VSFAISTAIGLVYPAFYAPPPEAPWTGPPVVITTEVLPELVATVPYTAQIVAEGGKTPYRFGLVSGELPPGLTFTSGGHISGTAPQLATIQPPTLPPARVDVVYSASLWVADLIYPFTVRVVDAIGQRDEQDYVLALWENPTSFSLESGNLPGCMSAGLSGAPMKVGEFPIVVHATDSAGRVITKSYTFVVRS